MEKTAPVRPRARPLSPHLQIYRLPLVALVSITHRLTGVFLGAGALVLTLWLMAVAGGPESFDQAKQWMNTWGMKTLGLGWIGAFYYHLLNGLRHLVWDAGYGFELKTAQKSAWIPIAGSLALTVGTVLYVCSKGGVA